MKMDIEKQLRALWKSIKTYDAPFPNMAEDIEEFLNAHEWELALDQMLDWAQATGQHAMAQKEAVKIRKEMKRLAAK